MTETILEWTTTMCDPCRAPLLRVTQAEALDIAVCPNCFAWGGYKEVILQHRGLSKTAVLPDHLTNLVENAWTMRILSE